MPTVGPKCNSLAPQTPLYKRGFFERQMKKVWAHCFLGSPSGSFSLSIFWTTRARTGATSPLRYARPHSRSIRSGGPARATEHVADPVYHDGTGTTRPQGTRHETLRPPAHPHVMPISTWWFFGLMLAWIDTVSAGSIVGAGLMKTLPEPNPAQRGSD